MSEPRRTYTIDEAAQKLRIGRNTAYAAAQRGEILKGVASAGAPEGDHVVGESSEESGLARHVGDVPAKFVVAQIGQCHAAQRDGAVLDVI